MTQANLLAIWVGATIFALASGISSLGFGVDEVIHLMCGLRMAHSDSNGTWLGVTVKSLKERAFLLTFVATACSGSRPDGLLDGIAIAFSPLSGLHTEKVAPGRHNTMLTVRDALAEGQQEESAHTAGTNCLLNATKCLHSLLLAVQLPKHRTIQTANIPDGLCTLAP